MLHVAVAIMVMIIIASGQNRECDFKMGIHNSILRPDLVLKIPNDFLNPFDLSAKTRKTV